VAGETEEGEEVMVNLIRVGDKVINLDGVVMIELNWIPEGEQ
jgi:hypothetical protein